MTPHYDFDTLPQRRGTHAAKWDVLPEEVLPLWVADMDFFSPPEVIEALDHAVQHGVFGYPYFDVEIKQTVVDWMHVRHNWTITPDDVVFLPGVVTGFNLAAKLAAKPGEGVLVQTPTYGPFLHVAGLFDLVQQEMQFDMGADGHYTVDLEAFEQAITPQTRIFMLCNPQNPTGRVFTQAELEGMAEICLRHNVLICSDEIHSDLVYPGHTHLPIASLAQEIAANTITLLAPSKTFNVAGLKASVAIIQNEELRQSFEKARQGLVGWVNMMGMVAMQAAYQHGTPWLDALLAYLETNRDLTTQFVADHLPGVQMTAPEGTFLAWLDCRELGFEPPKKDVYFNPFFEKQGQVALNEGGWFGAGGEGFVRLNFGCPRSLLLDALNRMKDALTSRA